MMTDFYGRNFAHTVPGMRRPGSYIDHGDYHGIVRNRYDDYTVPSEDAPDTGDRVYLGKWYPWERFLGGTAVWGALNANVSIKVDYRDREGSDQTLTLLDNADTATPGRMDVGDAETFGTLNPVKRELDVYAEFASAPTADEMLKIRLDFCS